MANVHNKCALTGKRGKFIESHLIPKALQHKPSPLLQYPMLDIGEGRRPEKRNSSWYDRALVIDEGEKILSKYDDAAIKILRKHKLVWSGWGPMQSLSVPEHKIIPNTNFALRKIDNIEVKPLRLFFLSLLWRAAATKLPEFNEISLHERDLAKLKNIVLRGKDKNPYDFPVSLIQMRTRGEAMNQTPFIVTRTIAPLDEKQKPKRVKYARFYFDGLIAQIGMEADDERQFKMMGPMALGRKQYIVLSTVNYEESYQMQNAEDVLLGAMHEHYQKIEQYFSNVARKREKAGLAI